MMRQPDESIERMKREGDVYEHFTRIVLDYRHYRWFNDNY